MLGKGQRHVFHFREGRGLGKRTYSEGAAQPSLQGGCRVQCQFHVYFPPPPSVCLGSLSLHLIKETAVCCVLQVGAQVWGLLASPGELVAGRHFASRSTLRWVRKPQPQKEGAQGPGEWEGQRGQESYFLPGTLNQQISKKSLNQRQFLTKTDNVKMQGKLSESEQ